MATTTANGKTTNDLPTGQKEPTANKDGLIEGEKSMYNRDLTVSIELIGDEKVNTTELMKCTRELCGGLVACRHTGTNKYELTMSHPKGKERLLEGFKIGNTRVMAKELTNDELVVSFLGLPAYTTDVEILGKLHGWGVSATSPIRRRMWPGTRIADGTRIVRVKFNQQVQSLPYSAKFNTALGAEYFRVIHDKQVKVCRICMQPGHILRECPEFMCHKCGVQGHYARECGHKESKCIMCYNLESKCVCNRSENEGDSISESGKELLEDSEGDEMSEEEGEGIMELGGERTSAGNMAGMPNVTAARKAGVCAGSSGVELGSSFDPIGQTTPTAEPEKGGGGKGLEKRPEPPPRSVRQKSPKPNAKPDTLSPSDIAQSPLQTPLPPTPLNADSDSEMDVSQINQVRKRQANEWQTKRRMKKNKDKKSSD